VLLADPCAPFGAYGPLLLQEAAHVALGLAPRAQSPRKAQYDLPSEI